MVAKVENHDRWPSDLNIRHWLRQRDGIRWLSFSCTFVCGPGQCRGPIKAFAIGALGLAMKDEKDEEFEDEDIGGKNCFVFITIQRKEPLRFVFVGKSRG